MSERILSMPGSTDRFIVTDRPAPTLTDRYRPLPDGMNNSHITVVPAHQAAAGDVIVAFFTDGPGTRHAVHVGFCSDLHGGGPPLRAALHTLIRATGSGRDETPLRG